MAYCQCCKHEGYVSKKCSVCGEFYYTDQEILVYYGEKKYARITARFFLSNKYFMLHKCKHFEKSSNGLGLLGGIVVSAVVLAAKQKKLPYAFYGMHELKEIIYPYCNKKFKKCREVKCVFKDGGDLILSFPLDTLARGVADRIASTGVTLIDGTGKHFGETYCEKPFLNEDTVGCRVVADAATKINMMKKNFRVEPIGGYAPEEPAPAPKAEPAPAPEAEPAPKAEPVHIEDLDIRVRAYNALRKANINRVDELTAKNREELKYAGVAEKELEEVEARLAAYGLQLAPVPQPEPAPQQMPQTLEDLNIRVMPYNKLTRAGIARIDQLTAKSAEELRQLGLIEAELEELEERLAEIGLALAQPPQPEIQPAPEQSGDTKFCRMCGTKIRRSDIFCLECGADQR